tara:strand:- start:992 stop:1417 length:426 start_codon:yes stop_codon:yes gene_type:complete
MAKPENRSQLMKYFGAVQRNTVWSWCAVNEDEREVYLSVWTDFRGDHAKNGIKSYIIQEPHWGFARGRPSPSPARKDHDEKLSKIFDDGYEAFGYFIEAKTPVQVPREIKSTKTSFIFSLDLERLPDGRIIGYPKQRIEVK